MIPSETPDGVSCSGPIGVFDSGLGGLTVVREILRLAPNERIVYIGDTVNVPYGGRARDEIRAFSLAMGRYLVNRAGCRAIVVACNTATAAGVDALRAEFSTDGCAPIPVVGMEPGIKPAVAATRSGCVGVLATVSTLSGDRFASLVDRYANGVRVITQPCPGLVECVERGDVSGPEARDLVRTYVTPLVTSGVDTIVLGCTHYPLLRPLIEQEAGAGVTIIDTGSAVAQRVVRLTAETAGSQIPGGAVFCWTTGGDPNNLAGFLLGDAAATLHSGTLHWKRGELYDHADTAS